MNLHIFQVIRTALMMVILSCQYTISSDTHEDIDTPRSSLSKEQIEGVARYIYTSSSADSDSDILYNESEFVLTRQELRDLLTNWYLDYGEIRIQHRSFLPKLEELLSGASDLDLPDKFRDTPIVLHGLRSGYRTDSSAARENDLLYVAKATNVTIRDNHQLTDDSFRHISAVLQITLQNCSEITSTVARHFINAHSVVVIRCHNIDNQLANTLEVTPRLHVKGCNNAPHVQRESLDNAPVT